MFQHAVTARVLGQGYGANLQRKTVRRQNCIGRIIQPESEGSFKKFANPTCH